VNNPSHNDAWIDLMALNFIVIILVAHIVCMNFCNASCILSCDVNAWFNIFLFCWVPVSVAFSHLVVTFSLYFI